MTDVHREVFDISAGVRYVAVARRPAGGAASRPDLRNASGADSDRFDEHWPAITGLFNVDSDGADGSVLTRPVLPGCRQ